LRLDKLILLALEATLRAHRDPDRLRQDLPVLRAITEPEESVRRRAAACLESLRGRVPSLALEVVGSTAQAGSGALPAQEIPSAALSVRHDRWSCSELARRLRTGTPAVFARIQNDAVLIDFRTVLPGEDRAILEALSRLELDER
jgi:L-seryl-tRNA(Ser) seleniumtransferase